MNAGASLNNLNETRTAPFAASTARHNSTANPAMPESPKAAASYIESLRAIITEIPRTVRIVGIGLLITVVVLAGLPTLYLVTGTRAFLDAGLLLAAGVIVAVPLLILFVVMPLNRSISAGQAKLNTQSDQLGALAASVMIEREQLRLERATTRGLFERNRDAIVLLTLDGQHIDVNEAACELLGYRYEELIRMNAKTVVAPEEYPQSQNILAGLLQGKQFAPYERTFIHKDGTRIPVEINISLIYDDHGRPMHIQSISRDIRDRKQFEQKQFALAVEREKVSMLTKLARLTEREIRSPLSLINMNLHWLANPDTDPRRTERLKNLEHEITRLNGVLENLGIIAQLENEPVAVRDSVNWNALVELAQTRLGERFTHSGLCLSCDLMPDLPTVEGDSRVLSHALINLMEYATEYADTGTCVHVRTYVTPGGSGVSRAVEVDLQLTSAQAATAHEQLFDTLTTRKAVLQTNAYDGDSKGSLRLIVARKILQSQRGSIRVDVRGNNSLIFKLTMPSA